MNSAEVVLSVAAAKQLSKVLLRLTEQDIQGVKLTWAANSRDSDSIVVSPFISPIAISTELSQEDL